MTILLGLGAALLFALSDWSGLRATRQLGPALGLALVVLVGLAPALAAWATLDGLPRDAAELRSLGLALLAGAAYYGGQLALFRGVQRGNLSVVAPIATLEGAVAVGIASGLGEHVGGLALAGIAVAIVGAALTALEPGRRTAEGAGYGVAAATLFGVAAVLWGHAQGGAAEAVAGSKLAGALLFLPLAAVLLRDREQRPATVPWGAVWLAATLELGALGAATTALSLGPISIASVCQSQYGTCGAILGLLLVNERLARHQLAGVAVTALGVGLIAWSGG